MYTPPEEFVRLYQRVASLLWREDFCNGNRRFLFPVRFLVNLMSVNLSLKYGGAGVGRSKKEKILDTIRCSKLRTSVKFTI